MLVANEIHSPLIGFVSFKAFGDIAFKACEEGGYSRPSGCIDKCPGTLQLLGVPFKSISRTSVLRNLQIMQVEGEEAAKTTKYSLTDLQVVLTNSSEDCPIHLTR